MLGLILRMDSYYTKSDILRQIAQKCNKFLNQTSTFVDFACGTNEFIKHLHCQTISFDIMPSENAIQADWLSVRSGIPAHSMIGINPPFGYKSAMAKKFINHAIMFNPRYIAVIIPTTNWKPLGFELIQCHNLPHNAFYIPETGKDFAFPTTFYIFERSDTKSSIAPKITLTFPSDINVRCHVNNDELKTANRSHCKFICIRRTGLYAGRQFYIGYNDTITYVHKSRKFINVDWEVNNHSLKNAFWVIFIDHPISEECMFDFCSDFEAWINLHASHFRENSRLNSPSLTKGVIADAMQTCCLLQA